MLWGCNGFPAQSWGYDAAMQTIYLRDSAHEMDVLPQAWFQRGAPAGGVSHPDASLCMDLNGGDYTPGALVQTWGCNGCWNQNWLLAGGVSRISADGRSEWYESRGPRGVNSSRKNRRFQLRRVTRPLGERPVLSSRSLPPFHPSPFRSTLRRVTEALVPSADAKA